MKFKFVSRNPYRDLARNLRRIVVSTVSDSEKAESFRKLHEVLKPLLKENTRFLNNQSAFSSRCQHWNQRSSYTSQPVKNPKNPWLVLKREFQRAVNTQDNSLLARSVSCSLAWFYADPHIQYWVTE